MSPAIEIFGNVLFQGPNGVFELADEHPVFIFFFDVDQMGVAEVVGLAIEAIVEFGPIDAVLGDGVLDFLGVGEWGAAIGVMAGVIEVVGSILGLDASASPQGVIDCVTVIFKGDDAVMFLVGDEVFRLQHGDGVEGTAVIARVFEVIDVHLPVFVVGHGVPDIALSDLASGEEHLPFLVAFLVRSEFIDGSFHGGLTA